MTIERLGSGYLSEGKFSLLYHQANPSKRPPSPMIDSRFGIDLYAPTTPSFVVAIVPKYKKPISFGLTHPLENDQKNDLQEVVRLLSQEDCLSELQREIIPHLGRYHLLTE